MRFAQAAQLLFEIADLTSHFGYVAIDLARGNTAFTDHAVEDIGGLSMG
jgi:hypothetical protein